jgi:hypothetical protein
VGVEFGGHPWLLVNEYGGGHSFGRPWGVGIDAARRRRVSARTSQDGKLQAWCIIPAHLCRNNIEFSVGVPLAFGLLSTLARRTPMTVTLLDLVAAVSHFARTESELIATVVHLVNSGEVTLGGNFRGARFSYDEVLADEVAA